MNFWVAQVIFLFSAFMQMFSMQRKNKEDILFFLFISVLSGAIGYGFLQEYEGVESLAMMTIFISFSLIFCKKKKEVPFIFTMIFLVVAFMLDLFEVQNIFDFSPMIASSCFMFGTTLKKEDQIRIFTLISLMLFLIFDIRNEAFSFIINDTIGALSAVAAMIRFRNSATAEFPTLNNVEEI